jgi:DNA-directed RNA polymerase subunit alpha
MIAIPQKPQYTALGEHHGKFEILGCYPGYGTTLGNAIRRVLLSSLEGAAIHSVKIAGVTHEFATIPGVMEDVVQILLHLKQIRFRLHSDEPVKLTLKVKGEGVVTASAFKMPSSVEIVNGDQIIATISDKKTELDMEIEIDRGLGYVPVEAREREEREIGVIAVDSIYSPVKRVNYEVENMRVGKRTDYDKITLEVITDGSITPEEAFSKGVAILMEQFTALSLLATAEAEVVAVAEEAVAPEVTPEATEEETPKAEKKSKKKAE